MTTQISIPTAALGFQGIANMAIGLYGLVRPTAFVAQLSSSFGSNVPRPVAYTSSMQLIYMGLTTLLAASRPSLHRPALTARIGLHFLAGYLFWTEGAKMRSLAIADLAFGVMNSVAIAFVGGA